MYWVFDEEHLERALTEWLATPQPQDVGGHAPRVHVMPSAAAAEEIREFLRSEAARKHKLIGGAS